MMNLNNTQYKKYQQRNKTRNLAKVIVYSGILIGLIGVAYNTSLITPTNPNTTPSLPTNLTAPDQYTVDLQFQAPAQDLILSLKDLVCYNNTNNTLNLTPSLNNRCYGGVKLADFIKDELNFLYLKEQLSLLHFQLDSVNNSIVQHFYTIQKNTLPIKYAIYKANLNAIYVTAKAQSLSNLTINEDLIIDKNNGNYKSLSRFISNIIKQKPNTDEALIEAFKKIYSNAYYGRQLNNLTQNIYNTLNAWELDIATTNNCQSNDQISFKACNITFNYRHNLKTLNFEESLLQILIIRELHKLDNRFKGFEISYLPNGFLNAGNIDILLSFINLQLSEESLSTHLKMEPLYDPVPNDNANLSSILNKVESVILPPLSSIDMLIKVNNKLIIEINPLYYQVFFNLSMADINRLTNPYAANLQTTYRYQAFLNSYQRNS